MTKSVNKSYWDNLYKNKPLQMVSKDNEIIKFIEMYIPNAKKEQSCLEIGCYPCAYLAYMGRYKHYTVNGIDYTCALNGELLKWLTKLVEIRHGGHVGSIQKMDLAKYVKTSFCKYDFVYSFGFIEHFKNYKQVIYCHDSLVNKGGYIAITAPNFRGKYNYILHRFFNYEDLKIHFLPSMQPEEWKKILESLGYKIIFSGYFGGFTYYPFNTQLKGIKAIVWKILKPVISCLNNILKKNNSNTALFCGIVAQKLL